MAFEGQKSRDAYSDQMPFFFQFLLLFGLVDLWSISPAFHARFFRTCTAFWYLHFRFVHFWLMITENIKQFFKDNVRKMSEKNICNRKFATFLTPIQASSTKMNPSLTFPHCPKSFGWYKNTRVYTYINNCVIVTS
jgi:hypothetical protein